MDPASLDTARVVAINQSLQVRQVCRDTEAARDHQNTLILVHGHTCSMRSTKQDEEICSVVSLRIVQQIASQTPLRLDEKIDRVLLTGPLRGYHERMTLQERPKANRGYPNIDMSSRSNFQRLLQLQADLDSTIVMRECRSREVVAENSILEDDAPSLQDEHSHV